MESIVEFVQGITPYQFLIVGAANWRLASLVCNENGAWHICKKFRDWCLRLCSRNKFCKELRLDELVTCEWCFSVWSATMTMIVWYLIGNAIFFVLYIGSISALVIFFKFIIQNMESMLNKREEK